GGPPASPLRIRPRAPPARLRPRASAARDCECPQPPQVEGRAHEIPFPAHLRHAAEGEATKAHRLLDRRVPANDVPYARGPKSAAGRRGAVAAPMRRRGRRPIEAPRSAAPNRSGDGAPASPHRRLGSHSRSWPSRASGPPVRTNMAPDLPASRPPALPWFLGTYGDSPVDL